MYCGLFYRRLFFYFHVRQLDTPRCQSPVDSISYLSKLDSKLVT